MVGGERTDTQRFSSGLHTPSVTSVPTHIHMLSKYIDKCNKTLFKANRSGRGKGSHGAQFKAGGGGESYGDYVSNSNFFNY